jgi:hypothetical protein
VPLSLAHLLVIPSPSFSPFIFSFSRALTFTSHILISCFLVSDPLVPSSLCCLLPLSPHPLCLVLLQVVPSSHCLSLPHISQSCCHLVSSCVLCPPLSIFSLSHPSFSSVLHLSCQPLFRCLF